MRRSSGPRQDIMVGRRLAPATALAAALMFVSLPAAGASATVSSHSSGAAATGTRFMSHPKPVPASGSGRTAKHWTENMRAGPEGARPAQTPAPGIPAHPVAPRAVAPRPVSPRPASPKSAAPQAVRVTAPNVTANFTGNDEGLGGQLAGDPNAATNGTTSCDVTKGAVADTSPPHGDVVAIGSAVNLRTSVGRPKTPCQ